MKSGRLRIRRPGGWSDRYRAYKILLDDEEIGEIRREEAVTISVAPGAHRVRMAIDWCRSEGVPIVIDPDATTSLLCRPRNPLPGIYWITLGRNRYPALALDPEPALAESPQPSTSR